MLLDFYDAIFKLSLHLEVRSNQREEKKYRAVAYT